MLLEMEPIPNVVTSPLRCSSCSIEAHPECGHSLNKRVLKRDSSHSVPKVNWPSRSKGKNRTSSKLRNNKLEWRLKDLKKEKKKL